MKMARSKDILRNSHDLSLYWSSDGFQVDGISYAGIPLFIRAGAMRIEFLPTEYSLHIAVIRGRSRSWKTWKAYGHCMLSFLRYMEAKNFDWRQPQEKYLAHYRTSLERRGLIRATVRRNMSIICDFYEWANARGYVKTLPFTREVVAVKARGMLSHLQRRNLVSKAVLLPKVPARKRFPRYFNREEQEQIFSLLKERDRLMMEWALYTGAREFEICNLLISDLPSPSAYRTRHAYPLAIIGKGSVSADLWVPTWLLDKTFQYVRFFGRAEVARALKKRHGAQPPRHVFLSRWGSALKPDSLYRAFRRAVKAANLKGVFHDLRHTFAISTLHKLMQLPQYSEGNGYNALLQLKYLMRHSSLTTTQIYLEARNFYLTEIYADLFAIPETSANG